MNDGYLLLAGILFAAALFLTAVLYGSRRDKAEVKVARIGVLLSLALVLGLLESFLPDFLLPGMRLGLANIAVLLVLYVYGFKEGLSIAIMKALLVSMLRGSMFSMGGLMALTGTFLSYLGMAGLHYAIRRCSIIGVSILGSLLHVSGQILVAWAYLGRAAWGYLPWLLLVGFLTGALVGFVTLALTKNKALLRYLNPKNQISGQNSCH